MALLVSCAAACSPPDPGRPVQVSESSVGAYEAALAADGGRLIAAWYDTRDGNGEIYFRRLGDGRRPFGPEHRITRTPEDSYEPSLAWVGDDVAVAWYERRDDGTSEARLGVWTPDGARLWEQAIAPSSRNPVLCVDRGAIFVAWIEAAVDGHEWVWSSWWDATGGPVGEPVRLAPASATTWNLNAAVDEKGSAWVVFDDASSTTSEELFLARVAGADVIVTRLTQDDGSPSRYPDVALSSAGQVAITWYDRRDGNEEVYLVVAPDGALDGTLDGRAFRVTQTPGESIGAYLAWNGARLGLAWSDQIGGQHEVHFQAFDAGGAPLDVPIRLTSNPTWSLVPAIRPWHDGFALAWNEYAPASEAIHDGTSEIWLAAAP